MINPFPFDYDPMAHTRTIEENNTLAVSEFLTRARQYIVERRPYEAMTIAILNEKAYDLYDSVIGATRAKSIN